MALTHFTFGAVGDASGGENNTFMLADGITSEGIVPSGSNQQTTAVAPAIGKRPYCRVATDTAVYVTFGTAPDATNAAARFFMPANSIDYFVVTAGHEAAVVTA